MQASVGWAMKGQAMAIAFVVALPPPLTCGAPLPEVAARAKRGALITGSFPM